MFSATRRFAVILALGVGIYRFLRKQHRELCGEMANTQARHIATFFRENDGLPTTEMLSADYLRQQFADGIPKAIFEYLMAFIYTTKDNRKNWHVTGSTVIAPPMKGACRNRSSLWRIWIPTLRRRR